MSVSTPQTTAGVEILKRGTNQMSGLPLAGVSVPGLVGYEDLVFGGWDIYEDNGYEAAVEAKVIEPSMLERLKEPLSAIKPMKAVFDQEYVKRINGPHVKTGKTKMDNAQALIDDILVLVTYQIVAKS